MKDAIGVDDVVKGNCRRSYNMPPLALFKPSYPVRSQLQQPHTRQSSDMAWLIIAADENDVPFFVLVILPSAVRFASIILPRM